MARTTCDALHPDGLGSCHLAEGHPGTHVAWDRLTSSDATWADIPTPRPLTADCPECGNPIIARPGYEHLKKFCSVACQDRDYRKRKAERTRPLSGDETAAIRADWDRIYKALVDAGVDPPLTEVIDAMRLVATVEQLQAEVDRLTANLATTTSQTGNPYRWHATGGEGTATIVSRIGGPAFALFQHGENAPVDLAEAVAGALNASPWILARAAQPQEPT